ETVRLFGGVEETCANLRDGGVRPLLDAFLVEKGTYPGRYLSYDKRRYLTLDQARTVVSGAPSIVPRLVEKGILIRGVLLKCLRSRQEVWYGLPELPDPSTCRRCYRSQKVSRGQLPGSPEPEWTYRLAEVVRQFLANEGDLPLLVAWDQFGAT